MKMWRAICLLLLASTIVCFLSAMMVERSQVSGLSPSDMDGDRFRAQMCSETFLDELGQLPREEHVKAITVSMLMEQYAPSKVTLDDHLLLKYKGKTYESMLDAYEKIWSDITYFPVASDTVTYEDTWLAPRQYQEKRLHQGCDLFGSKNVSGLYPIVSMTEGVVEKMGWLPLGGYRIGIRSPHGGYFYYAHLSGYEERLRQGSKVNAGEIIGYMGDTGYGKEGTSGQFPVHLHLGIYLSTKSNPEVSVNPYWILRYIHKKRINYR